MFTLLHLRVGLLLGIGIFDPWFQVHEHTLMDARGFSPRKLINT